MKKNYYWLVLSITGLMMAGCHQNTSPATTGIGRVTGAVKLVDTMSNVLINSSGIHISPENSTRFVLSDSLGNFTIDSLPDGVATLVFSKPGFAEFHLLCQVNDPPVRFGTLGLYAISHLTPNIVIRPFEDCTIRYNFRDTQIFSFEAGGHFIHVWVYDSLYEEFGIAQFSSRVIDGPNYAGQYGASVQFFFSSQDNISPQDPGTFQFATEQTGVGYDGIGTITIYRDSLLHHGFTANSLIKCAAFTTGPRTHDIFYTDKATGKKIYTGLSPIHSEIRSFILP